jgi:mono/diheme cytochrome c family protein
MPFHMATLSGRKQIVFWIAAALIATATLAAVLVWESREAAPRRSAYITGVPERGSALFFGSKQCSICHAINGRGGHVAPDLSGNRPIAPAMGWLTTVLWNHGPGMWRQMRHGNQSYPHLDSQEMADVLAFLYQAGSVDPAGDPEAGQRVFSEKTCVRCHSVRGSGGKVGPELSAVVVSGGSSEWTRTMWNHAQSMIEPITKASGQWPQFFGGEMNDLIAYVTAGAPDRSTGQEVHGNAERGWRVFQAKCIQCHTVRGQGGSVGPELGPEHDVPLTTARFASLLWNHAPAMLQQGRDKGIAPPVLQGDEMTDLLAFLASLRYFEPTGSPFTGERVFAERGCAGCHGPAAEGTKNGPRLRPGAEAFTTVSFTTALWRHGPSMIDRAESMGVEWPILKPSDVGDLVSFLNAPARQK